MSSSLRPFLALCALAASACTPEDGTPIDPPGLDDAGTTTPPDDSTGATCADAITADTGTLTGTTVGAGDEYAPSCGAAGTEDLVYEVVLTEASGLRVTVSGYDAVLVVVNDTCTFDEAGTNELGCQDSLEAEAVETLAFPSLAAGTYYIVLDGYEGAAGNFTLDVEIQPGGICVGDDFDGEGDADNDVPERAVQTGAADLTTADDPATEEADPIPLVLCEGDTDVFAIGHMGGDLTVTVDGADGALAVATTTADVETLGVTITGAGAASTLSGPHDRGWYLLTVTKSGDLGATGAAYSFTISHGCDPDAADDADPAIDVALDDVGEIGFLEPLAAPDERSVCGTDVDAFTFFNAVAGDVVATIGGGANLGVTVVKRGEGGDTTLASPGDYTTSETGGDLVVTIPAADVGGYQIVVDAGGAATNVPYTFQLAFAGLATPPANDVCADHVALTPGEAPTPVAGRTLGGVDHYDSPCNGDDGAEPGVGAPEVFYSFTLAAPSSIGISFDGTATEFTGSLTLVSLPGGACPANVADLVPIEVAETPLCRVGEKFELQVADLPAGDYGVVVDGEFFDFFGLFQLVEKGTFDVAVKTYPDGLPPPASCTTAQAITLPAIGAAALELELNYDDAADDARNFYGDCSGGGGGAEQVYAFTPAANATVSVVTAGYDTVVALYAEECGAQAFAQCNDDDPAGGLGSAIEVPVVAGTPYFLVVDAYGPLEDDDTARTATITITTAAP